jgi:predicted Co/Zn/Cd cation transporter (cation efflux family)
LRKKEPVMYTLLLIIGLTVCVLSLSVTILIGVKPRDSRYNYKVSLRNLFIIYAIIMILAGVGTYLLFFI